MKYETIYTDFKNLFSEEKEYFSTCEKNSVIGDDGDELSHMSFGIFVMPFIYRLLGNEDDARLRKAFSFFEDMAKSEDYRVQNLLQVTILENLTTESEEIYKAAQKYIGPETKKFVNQVATYMNIEPMI